MEPASDVFGYVTLADQYGVKQGESFITHDPMTGQLTYTIDNLVPGVYTLEADIFYRGDDGITRIYRLIVHPDSPETTQEQIIISLDSAVNGTVTLPNLYLVLDGSVCSGTP